MFEILPLSDIHLGSAGCDISKLQETINYILASPNRYWIGIGDYLDCINITDHRFDPYSIDPRYNIPMLSRLIKTQTDDLISFLTPIKEKCLGLLTGNHEETIRLRYHHDVLYEICERWDMRGCNIGYDGFIRLRFIRNKSTNSPPASHVFVIYASHGFGGSRTSGPKVNRLEGVAHSFDADIIILAHEHKKVIAPPIIKLGLNERGDLIQKKQIAVMSGSFKKSYVQNATSYEEKAGYPPSDLGTVKIMVTPETRDLRASL